jgi:hypothetical protein
MHESGRIMGEDKESNETLKTAKRLLDCNGERCTRIYTKPRGWAINTPFPPNYDNKQNRLKLAFREQDKIVWDNLLKVRMGKQWIEYAKQHMENDNIKLQAKESAPKSILALWDHMRRLWQYRNDALHEDNSK